MRFIGKFIGFLLNVFLCLAIIAILVGVWGVGFEPGRVRVNASHMTLGGLPPKWPAIKIAVLSDLHIGAPLVGIAKLEEIVETVNAEKPDMIFLLGDFMPDVFFSTEIAPRDFAPVLGKLKAKNGIVAILGEHDMRGDSAALRAALKKAGIAVLVNQSLRIDLGKKRRIWIVGLASTGPSYAKSITRIPKKAPVLALVHNPAVFTDIPLNVTGVFAGHSHGGLINLPKYGPVLLPEDMPWRYTRGIIKEDAKVMFVSTGIGTGAYPIRVYNQPEIAMVTISAFAK